MPPPPASWHHALEVVSDRLTDLPDSWMVVGSVAAVLQGCDFMPNDLDILVPSELALDEAAGRFKDFPNSDRVTQSFPSGFSWDRFLFEVSGFKVEIVHIASGGPILDSEDGSGIWEGGRLVWSYLKKVPFSSRQIPVVPLEIQLESQFRRELSDRVAEIISVLQRSGIDYSFLKKALSHTSFEAFSAHHTEKDAATS